MLRFATCKYIEEGRHIILSGASSGGKTYIACALGNAACRKFLKVRYVRLPELLEELNVAKGTGEFRKTIRSYLKLDLNGLSVHWNRRNPIIFWRSWRRASTPRKDR